MTGMRSNTVAMSLRHALSLAELLSYLSRGGIFQGSFFMCGSGGISDCWRQCLVVSGGGLCLLVEAVPQGCSGSLSFLFRDLIVFIVASLAFLIIVSLLIWSWVSCSIFFFVHSCSWTSWSLTSLNSLRAASTIKVVLLIGRLVIPSYCFVNMSAIWSVSVFTFSDWEVLSACNSSSSAWTCCLSTLSSSYSILTAL